MILISIILSGITSIHRHCYILLLNYTETFLQCVLRRVDVISDQISGGENFVRGGESKKGPPHEEKIVKTLPLREKCSP